jgi:hypothetical protein
MPFILRQQALYEGSIPSIEGAQLSIGHGNYSSEAAIYQHFLVSRILAARYMHRHCYPAASLEAIYGSEFLTGGQMVVIFAHRSDVADALFSEPYLAD